MPEEILTDEEAEMEEDLGESIDDKTLDSLSPEELDARLNERINAEEEPDEEEESTEPEPEPEEKEPEPAKEPEKEPEKEPAKEPEKEPDPAKPAEQKAETLEERVARVEGENAALLEKYERQKTQLGRWSNEIGEMRRLQKKLDDTQLTDDEFAAKMEENPREAIRMEQERLRAQAESKELEEKALRDSAEESIRGQVSDFDELMPEIVELARKKYKLADWGVESFKKDPFMFNEREVLDLARDAKLIKLEARLASAKTETPEPKNGGSLADKINRAARKSPRLSGGSGQGTDGKAAADLTEDDLSDRVIDGMSEEALAKMLRERGVPI